MILNMAKTRKRQSKSTTKKKRHKQKIISFSAILFFLILLGFHFTFSITTSTHYKSNQQASLTNTTLYSFPYSILGKKQTKQTDVVVSDYYLVHKNGKKLTYAKIKFSGQSYYVLARDLKLKQTNSINTYLEEHRYPKTTFSTEYQGFSKQAYQNFWKKPRGVIIHDTGNEDSSIDSEVSYMTNNYSSSGVFVHAFIDSNTILRIADTNYMAQGAGPYANPYYIQFEMTHEYTADGFARQVGNAAYYTAYMLKKYNLPVTLGQKDGDGTLWTHEMVSLYLGGTDHIDPTAYWSSAASEYFGSDYTIEDFQDLVQAYYNEI